MQAESGGSASGGGGAGGPLRALAADAVWDGGRMRRGCTVLVEGERIAGVLAAGGAPEGAAVERLEGCTLLPGLIDCHVHLADWMMPGFLAAGVTTVRDTGNRLDWILERRARTAADPASGPRILCCGPVLDGEKVNWPIIGRGHRGVREVAASVEELAGAGVDAVKLYVNLTGGQIEAAVRRAGELGLPVLAHLGSVDAEAAAAAGVGEIEHLSGCVHHVEGGGRPDAGRDSRWAAAFLEARVVLCPTLVVWDRLSRVNDAVFANDRRARWVHPVVRAAWRRFPHRTSDPAERLARQAAAAAMKQTLGRLYEEGCRIIAGSDAPWPGLVPGFSLHDELSLMVDAGMPAEAALAAATSGAADALGLDGVTGRIRTGLAADLLAVEGDPTADITVLSEVRAVVRMGALLDRRALAETARAAFERAASSPISRLIDEYASP